MRNFYAYIRVSTVKQGERGSSLLEQRNSIEGYARRQNLSVIEWFEEKETAAKRGRRVFNRMLKLLEKRTVIGVIIHKIDRSARNLRDWADLAELIDRGVEVHFAHESLDLQSRGGRLSADIQAVVAADFIRNLRDEVRKGFNGRLRQGLYPLPAPIGYKDQGRGLPKTPNPATAPLVRRAFELYSSGRYNLDMLGQEMHGLGIRNRRGGRVTRNGFSTMLNNEFYIGIIHIRRTGQRFQGVHEPIIGKGLFDRVQALLAGKTQNRGIKHDFLYRKTLRCVHCGYSLIAERQKGHIYYRCHTPNCPPTCLREEEVDRQAIGSLLSVALQPEELPEFVTEIRWLMKKKGDDSDQLLQSSKLLLAQLDDRLIRLTDSYVDRLIDREAFEKRNTRLLHERATIQSEIEELTSGNGSTATKVEKFLELVEALSNKEKIENPYERRQLLQNSTSNLCVDQKNLVVTWQSPFQVLAERSQIHYGDPYRDRPRTSIAKRPWMKRLVKELKKLERQPLADDELDAFLEAAHRKKYAHSYKQMEEINKKRHMAKVKKEWEPEQSP